MAEERASFDFAATIAAELQIAPRQAAAVIGLIAEKNTVPFIARYRKEATGDLDEVQIRAIEERHAYLRELEERRQAILASIADQGRLTPGLEANLRAATTKAALEDLYLPYKPKRRTRAMIARERGLQPLADRILSQAADGDPRGEAEAFVAPDQGVPDVAAALAGARDIVAETVAETAAVRQRVRDAMMNEGLLVSTAAAEAQAASKFQDYFDHRERIAAVPSHRFLAMRRGERENELKLKFEVDEERLGDDLLGQTSWRRGSPFADELALAVTDGLKRLLLPSVESDVRIELKLRADREAVEIFASNLRHLLLAAPFGERAVLGVDPGLRTGCKLAALDATGRFLGNTTVYPTQGDRRLDEARRELVALIRRHAPKAVAIGNGTASRETERFVRDTLREAGIDDVIVVVVSEAGASVYSASDVAREEFPELDLTVRGAISIGRRLQDPLAELVKIEPQAIGVGQYQHDVHQPLLVKKLDEVVESCVNHVGVELNTASAELLSHVAGIGPALARRIVEHRVARGAFRGRKQLREVTGLGPRAFEQAAGFLRVRGGDHPLDASAVHPERYELVARIAEDLGVGLADLVGNRELVGRIEPARWVSDGVGLPTLRDIIAELEKPGRDPRDVFEPPRFRDDVQSLADLVVGMELEGVVTNVTAFGCFVDIGVHRDGLVHISQLADRFVQDAREVVRPGEKITVRVLEVDAQRERISLSARREGARREQGGRPPPGGDEGTRPGPRGPKGGKSRQEPERFGYNPFAKLKLS